ncbi:uncharacterized protein LOC133811451 [Humulus lupulus]|uniref:uncharacterized protein LOC133811451 n=1 Tax=Humulus lupulus TaxID=3486 RepID=UPI002B410794|nr:uncharacterized protein LOC133811451 [Humulus lupulus]
MILLLSTPVTKLSHTDLWSSLSNPVAIFSSLETFSWVVICGAAEINDPKLTVHGKPLGLDFMRVWVDADIVLESYLFRPNNAMLTIQEAVGSTVAWPSKKVIPRDTFSY